MSVTKERWRDLCKQAAIEKDPQKLAELYAEINAIVRLASSSSAQARANEHLTAADRKSA